MMNTQYKIRMGVAACAAALLVACGGGDKDVEAAANKAAGVIENAEGVVEGAAADAADVAEGAKDMVGDAMDKTGDAMEDMAEGAKDMADDAMDKTGDAMGEMADGAMDKAGDAMDDMADDAMDKAEDAMGVAVSPAAQPLVDQCVAEGESAKVCGCQVTAVEDSLGEENFNKLLDLAKADDEAGAEALMTEIMSSDPQKAMQMATSIMGCSE